jgi:2-polyprenyl-6-methoxyphenol hydroxylase-like FAD-dependent oxidoreductase
MARIVVCGGSIIGLSTAMLLARDGHDVTVVEQDPSEAPQDPASAWQDWHRRGVAQFRQPHLVLSRARQILDTDLPGLTDQLLDAGCVSVNPLAELPPTFPDRTPRPGDDRFRLVTGRRPVVEAVVAQAATRQPGVTIRRGVGVRGLLANLDRAVPHVQGVFLDGGEELRADLVVDATGRHTRLSGWLAPLTSMRPTVEAEDSGFIYYTRYFTGPEPPALRGPPVAALGSISVLTLIGDNSTWSVTVWTSARDTALRALRDIDRFTRVVGGCPGQAHWLGGQPITDVLVMGGILDRYRRFVVDGRPVATGVVAVGDAWACTNPSAGRGLSVGLLHAQRLRDAARDGLADPDAVVLRFDALTERDVTPFYRDQITADRRRLAEIEALRDGNEPAPPADPTATALGEAMPYDADVFRGLLEMVNCLALPQEVLNRPGFRDRIAARSGERPMGPPAPSRAELLDLVR